LNTPPDAVLVISEMELGQQIGQLFYGEVMHMFWWWKVAF